MFPENDQDMTERCVARVEAQISELEGIAREHAQHGRGERSQEAMRLADLLRSTVLQMRAHHALSLDRLAKAARYGDVE